MAERSEQRGGLGVTTRPSSHPLCPGSTVWAGIDSFRVPTDRLEHRSHRARPPDSDHPSKRPGTCASACGANNTTTVDSIADDQPSDCFVGPSSLFGEHCSRFSWIPGPATLMASARPACPPGARRDCCGSIISGSPSANSRNADEAGLQASRTRSGSARSSLLARTSSSHSTSICLGLSGRRAARSFRSAGSDATLESSQSPLP